MERLHPATAKLMEARMSSGKTSYITVTSHGLGAEVTCIYAVNEDILRELDGHIPRPTGTDLRRGLRPRVVRSIRPTARQLSGAKPMARTMEVYYCNGKLHREGSPAVIRHNADGSIEEEYYRDGVKQPTPKTPNKTSAPSTA
jgi:hypothetical protein